MRARMTGSECVARSSPLRIVASAVRAELKPAQFHTADDDRTA